MTRRFDAEAHRAEIVAMIEAGAVTADIAQAFGVSYGHAWRALRRLGIPVPDQRRARLVAWNRSDAARMANAERLRERWKDPAFREAQRCGCQWSSIAGAAERRRREMREVRA